MAREGEEVEKDLSLHKSVWPKYQSLGLGLAKTFWPGNHGQVLSGWG